jgi:hypothetical protein
VAEPQPVVEAPIEAPAADSDGTGTIGPQRAQAALEGVLEALGSAHHRPFSRG